MDHAESGGGQVIEVGFVAEATSIDAIQRAAYRFSDRFSCELHPGDPEHRCLLRPVAEIDAASELESFRTEVLDQTLRQRIREETEPIRTMILAQAFSRTGVVDPKDLG